MLGVLGVFVVALGGNHGATERSERVKARDKTSLLASRVTVGLAEPAYDGCLNYWSLPTWVVTFILRGILSSVGPYYEIRVS